MKLEITAALDYRLGDPVDLMLHIEAAAIPEQLILDAVLDVGNCEYFARVPAQDMIGDRIWLRRGGELNVRYRTTVEIVRNVVDYRRLDKVPMHRLPGETVQYLNESRYCPANKFIHFVQDEFGDVEGPAGGVPGGALVDVGAVGGHLHQSPEAGGGDPFACPLLQQRGEGRIGVEGLPGAGFRVAERSPSDL